MVGARRSVVAAVVLVAACGSGEAGPSSSTVPPSTEATAPSTTSTTASTVVAPGPAVIPAVGRTPQGVNPRSACMQRADFGAPEDSPYLLPFRTGERYRVGQSYCYANGGHQGQLAYDFDMPIGAEVLAARAGTVVDSRDDSPDDGQGNGEHNYLMIRHADGTVAFYAHLRQRGLLVGVGDDVEAGDPIAYAGNSGLTSGPHLHFGVYQGWPTREGRDLPVVFRNAGGSLDLLGGLIAGSTYEALPAGTVPEHRARPPSDHRQASLAGLVLPRANLWGYDFTDADLRGADLSESLLAWTTFAGAALGGADLTHTDLTGADLRGADLRGARLVGSILSRAELRGADLSGADLTGVYAEIPDLSGADLSGATMDDIIMIAPEWDDETVWPADYDPPPAL